MKRCSSIAIAIFFAAQLSAQEDAAIFFPEGTVWEEERHCYFENEHRFMSSYYRNTVEGDTTINGKTYKNVLVEMRTCDDPLYDDDGNPVIGWDRESAWHWVTMGHYYGIREEENKVYYFGDYLFGYNGVNPEEHLIYDFEWVTGKEIPVYFNTNGEMQYKVITDIDHKELTDGDTYDCLCSSDGSDLLQVRGVGNLSNRGGLFRYMLDFPWDASTLRYRRVLSFMRNGELVYQWDRDSYLEERLGVSTLSKEAPVEDEAVFMCDGRRVSPGTDIHRLHKGIYVRRGRLFVVK